MKTANCYYQNNALRDQSIYFFFKGRVALYAVLKAMGVKEGEEVLLPGFTCYAVPFAIIYLGARPVYVDIDPKTYNIDTEKIEEKITEKTRVIIAQHTFGIPAEMNNIVRVAKKHNLFLIEDSAHAIGSRYKGNEVGTIGDAAFFSSHWSKPVTTGLGGWTLVNNQDIKEKMERIYPQFLSPSFIDALRLRLQYLAYSSLGEHLVNSYAKDIYMVLSKFGLAVGSTSDEEFEGKLPKGYEKKMSSWQINLLQEKLRKINKCVEHRKWITSTYEALLNEKGIKTLKLQDGHEPVFLRYPLLVNDKDKVLEEAHKKRMEIGDWYIAPVNLNLERWKLVGYEKGTCPIAEGICQHVINLPTNGKVDEGEAMRIVRFLVESKYVRSKVK
jgi:dTDP-4-amino-4,6-dideoxygalactose transaminase